MYFACGDLVRLRQRIAREHRARNGRQRDESERAVYQALSERHLSADVRALSSLQRGGDLSAYRIVFFPHAHVLTAEDIAPLIDYVEGGGTLVFGCWSGYRNRNHWCYDAPGKAFFENFIGARVEDFTVVIPGEVSTIGSRPQALRLKRPFSTRFLRRQPAMSAYWPPTPRTTTPKNLRSAFGSMAGEEWHTLERFSRRRMSRACWMPWRLRTR